MIDQFLLFSALVLHVTKHVILCCFHTGLLQFCSDVKSLNKAKPGLSFDTDHQLTLVL